MFFRRMLIALTLLSGQLFAGCGSGDPQQQGSFEVDGREPGRQQLRPIQSQETTPEDFHVDETTPVPADEIEPEE